MLGNPIEKTETGLSVDWRWEDPKTKNDPLAICIRRNMFVQAPKYYFFMGFDFLLTIVGTSVLPLAAILLIAFGRMGTDGAIWCFAFVIVCSVLNYWLHPHTQQLAYEAAVQENQKARVAYIAGDHQEARSRLDRAIELTQPKLL